MGTMMKDGTEITMVFGFFLAIIGTIDGVTTLMLNKYGKIAE